MCRYNAVKSFHYPSLQAWFILEGSLMFWYGVRRTYKNTKNTINNKHLKGTIFQFSYYQNGQFCFGVLVRPNFQRPHKDLILTLSCIAQTRARTPNLWVVSRTPYTCATLVPLNFRLAVTSKPSQQGQEILRWIYLSYVDSILKLPTLPAGKCEIKCAEEMQTNR